MSGTVGLLFGLLLLSYVGNAASGPRLQRLFGLASGAEYVLLGFVLGPVVLGVIQRSWTETFTPMMLMGSAWLGLVAGLDCGRAPKQQALGRVLLGVVLTAFVAVGMGAATWGALHLLATELTDSERLRLSAGVAALTCATTQHALRWTISGFHCRGLLSNTLLDLSQASLLVPVVILSVLESGGGSGKVAALSLPARLGLEVGAGVVLGGLGALLLGREFRRDESWGLLLGLALFGTGICSGLGLSAVGALFTLGLVLGLCSSHRDEIRAMLLPTERPVVLPIALLAGAWIDPGAYPAAVWVAVVVVLARGLMELLRGSILFASLRAARGAGPWVALSFTSAGSFTLAACVELALQAGGTVGKSLFVIGCIVLLVGEVVGPMMLRRALVRAGDIPDAGIPSVPPPSSVGGAS